jgi:hypothetical protein
VRRMCGRHVPYGGPGNGAEAWRGGTTCPASRSSNGG